MAEIRLFWAHICWVSINHGGVTGGLLERLVSLTLPCQYVCIALMRHLLSFHKAALLTVHRVALTFLM